MTTPTPAATVLPNNPMLADELASLTETLLERHVSELERDADGYAARVAAYVDRRRKMELEVVHAFQHLDDATRRPRLPFESAWNRLNRQHAALVAAGKLDDARADGTTASSRVASYLSAEAAHAMQGPASREDVDARTAICNGCDARSETIDGARDPGGLGWCTKCGCGSAPRAALSVKLTLAGATCPLGKWDRVNGTGATVTSVAEAVGGVAATVASAIWRAASGEAK
jgi:hypothetical protein